MQGFMVAFFNTKFDAADTKYNTKSHKVYLTDANRA